MAEETTSSISQSKQHDPQPEQPGQSRSEPARAQDGAESRAHLRERQHGRCLEDAPMRSGRARARGKMLQVVRTPAQLLAKSRRARCQVMSLMGAAGRDGRVGSDGRDGNAGARNGEVRVASPLASRTSDAPERKEGLKEISCSGARIFYRLIASLSNTRSTHAPRLMITGSD